jgi:GST-like protein
MTDPTYTPPKVWTWDKASGGRFASINRPIAGPDARQGPAGRQASVPALLAGTPNGVKVTIMFEELLAAGHAGCRI